MTEPKLEYVGRDFVTFDDRSFRWVDVKRFRLPDGVSGEDALKLLLRHVRYRDHYTSADSHARPTNNLHGPYWLDHITPAAFEAVDEEAALKTISDFAVDRGEMRPEVVASLDHDVYSSIRAMPVRYRLKDLGEGAIHEFGWVLNDFYELVLLDPSAQQLVLVVAAID